MRTLGTLGIGLAVALSACGSQPVEMDFDVEVTADRIRLHVRDPRTCRCTNEDSFPFEAGRCGYSSDGISCACDPPPASCMQSLRVEDGGAVVVEAPWDEWSWIGASVELTTAQLGPSAQVVASGCGTEVALPVGALPMPSAAIASFAPDGLDLVVEWTTQPAGQAVVVGVGDGYTGTKCQVTGQSIYRFAGYSDIALRTVSVFAIAGPVVHATPFGEARVWSGIGELRWLYPL